MRFVGIAALAATFWLVVATVRLMLSHQCPAAQSAASTPLAAPAINAHPCTITRWQHRHDQLR